jgi:hypothetical protein
MADALSTLRGKNSTHTDGTGVGGHRQGLEPAQARGCGHPAAPARQWEGKTAIHGPFSGRSGAPPLPPRGLDRLPRLLLLG